MKVDIPYGTDKIEINIDEQCEILIPKKVDIKDEDKIIDKALENSLGPQSFDDFANDSKRILVIVNDATRPTPTSKILKYLLPVLSSHPDVKFLVATGAHRAPTEEEYRFIFGDTYEVFRRKVYAHDARKDEVLTSLFLSIRTFLLLEV